MKIAIGHHIQDGPYGGGNSLVLSFLRLFTEAGHQVTFNLDDSDIDILVMPDPRSRSSSISFAAGAAFRYVAFRNSRAIVVQLIQDCDERKNTRRMNRRQRIANYCADHAIVVGSWMLDLDLVQPGHRNQISCILNGGRPGIFHSKGHDDWDGHEPLRMITHHWGAHWMKGFDVYTRIDALLDDPAWRNRIAFTYVGNKPADVDFRNARYLPPLNGQALAEELRAHHVYITGSINEPAGLHHIEGALCGLPILYRRSGGLPEYCDGFGIAFDGPRDIDAAIGEMQAEYGAWRATLSNYGHTEIRMTREYLELFEELLARRDQIDAERLLWRNPLLVLLNQIPF